MRLRELFSDGSINLSLTSTTKDAILAEMIGLLRLDDASRAALFRSKRCWIRPRSIKILAFAFPVFY